MYFHAINQNLCHKFPVLQPDAVLVWCATLRWYIHYIFCISWRYQFFTSRVSFLSSHVEQYFTARVIYKARLASERGSCLCSVRSSGIIATFHLFSTYYLLNCFLHWYRFQLYWQILCDTQSQRTTISLKSFSNTRYQLKQI